MYRKSNPLKTGLLGRCRFCRKVFRIGEMENGASQYIWPDEVDLAVGQIVEYRTEEGVHAEVETKAQNNPDLKRTRSFRRRASIGFQRAWTQARVVSIPRQTDELLQLRTMTENTHLELDFATDLDIEIMPSQDRVSNNMWMFATVQFSKPPYSNGEDTVYVVL